MKTIRSYGTLCPKCAKLFEIEKIDLERDPQLADLRATLAHQGGKKKLSFVRIAKLARNAFCSS